MILELNTYKTKAGVPAANHLENVSRAHQALIANRTGFLHRVVGQVSSETDSWADIAAWRSREHFDLAASDIPGDPASAPWLQQIDMAALRMQTLTLKGTIAFEPNALCDPSIGCWAIVSWRIFPNVDPAEHQASGEHVHREVLAKYPGYRGAYLTRPTEGEDWIELMGWADTAAAHHGIEDGTKSAITGSDPVAKKHIAEADPASVRMILVSSLARF